MTLVDGLTGVRKAEPDGILKEAPRRTRAGTCVRVATAGSMACTVVGRIAMDEIRTNAPLGSVEQILIAGPKGTPRDPVDSVVAVAGMGLIGDRYFGQKPGRYAADRQVTLIEAEAVEAVRDGGIPFTAADARRNVVTRGVRLNELVGRTLRVGSAVLRGVQLCHPCGHLAKLTHRGVTRDLKMRGGLRAEVLDGGDIRVGDSLALLGTAPELGLRCRTSARPRGCQPQRVAGCPLSPMTCPLQPAPAVDGNPAFRYLVRRFLEKWEPA